MSGSACAVAALPARPCGKPVSFKERMTLADHDSMSQAAPRQTLTYLRNLFAARGIHPKNKLGQNFLIDLNLLDVLLRAAELTRDDLALEVGSGTGSLTVRLAQLAGAVVSVEVDPAFASLAREEVQHLVKAEGRVLLLRADILK